MKRKVLSLLAFMTLFLAFQASMAEKDEKTLQEYPGGEYGIYLGGGYQVLPSGEFIASSPYRSPYIDTSEGPVAGDEFVVFPDYYIGERREKVTRKIKGHYYTYYETPITPKERIEIRAKQKYEEAPEEVSEEIPEEALEEISKKKLRKVTEKAPEEAPEETSEKEEKKFFDFF